MISNVSKAIDRVEAKFNHYDVENRVIVDRLTSLEQRGGAMPGEYVSSATAGIGSQVVKAFRDNSELFAKTRSVRLEIATKAASDPMTASGI